MIKEAFIQACRDHRFSPKTTKSYWCAANAYIKWIEAETIEQLKTNATDNFKAYLQAFAKKNPSESCQRLAFHSVRFLLVAVAAVQLPVLRIMQKSNGARRLVEVPDEVTSRKLTESEGAQGLALRLIYGTGCRLSEVLKLKIADLDFTKNLISIHFSKGGKSRLVPLPKSLVKELQELIKGRDSGAYVFPADKGDGHMADRTLQRALNDAKQRHGIKKNYTIHSLRHACAQWLERHGVERSRIQLLLGHAHSSTTDLYLTSGIKNVSNIPTPI